MRIRSLVALSPALSLAVACSGSDDPLDASVIADSGVVDTGVVNNDAGQADAAADAGVDAGPADTGPQDMGVDAGTPQSIVFLHTNDEHSHFFGFSPNYDDFPTASTMESIKGGVYRRAALLAQLETEAARPPIDSPVVTVSAGDVPMGSLFHVGNLITSPDYIVQSTLQYDVMTLGNHEFDFGPGVLSTMIENGYLDPLTQTTSQLRIPLVVSNIRFDMDSAEDDGLEAQYGDALPIRRTFVRDYGNVKVGFVGIVGLDASLVAPFKTPVRFSLAVDDTQPCTSNTSCPGSVCVPAADDPTASIGFCAIDPAGTDPAINMPALVADIAGAVAEVRAQDVDIVVAVSHAGIDEREVASLNMMGLGLENAQRSEELVIAREVEAVMAAQGMTGIDLIIGGHSHTALQDALVLPHATGNATYIAQAGSYGAWVGKLRFTRPDVSAFWQIDSDYSGLVEVNGTIDTSGLGIITQMVLDGVINLLMNGLEADPIAVANDGLIFPGELCDRTAGGQLVAPGRGQCTAVSQIFTGGTLDCHPNRQLDFSGCTVAPSKAFCGDNSADDLEQCDGTDVPACTTINQEYIGGTSACAANCTVDVSGCTVRFPSLLEAALNFERPLDEPQIQYGGTNGDLFFHVLGTTAFDVGGKQQNNESNLLNLVADANRFAANTLDPANAQDPIRVNIVANGVVRDGLFAGQTGNLAMADLFRVLPLGISPQENTPGFTLIDFHLNAQEVKQALEVGVGAGSTQNSFWLGVSGARVTYDPSRADGDRITRIELIETTETNPAADTNATYELYPLYDSALGFEDPNRLVHMSTDLYVGLYATAFGICPRDASGAPFPHCAPCTTDAQCTVDGSTCNMTAGICEGGDSPVFAARSLIPIAGGFGQELKEFLALMAYIRRLPGDAIPGDYNGAVPRRHCCEGASCPADNSRTCQ